MVKVPSFQRGLECLFLLTRKMPSAGQCEDSLCSSIKAVGEKKSKKRRWQPSRLALGTGTSHHHDFWWLVPSPQRGRPGCLFLLPALFLYLTSTQHGVRPVNISPAAGRVSVGFSGSS